MGSVGDQRVANLEARVEELEHALSRMRADQPVAPRPEPSQASPATAGAPAVAQAAQPIFRPPVRSSRPARTLKTEDLLGPRALAFAGGSVLLLGIAFFLAIAVDRGWIGEEARVILGFLFCGGLLAVASRLRNRHGKLEAARVAAGVAVAGLQLTILAAAPLYDLIPPWLGVLCSMAFALGSIPLAISWRTEALALIGLSGSVGAVPVILGGIELEGLLAVGILSAAGCAVAVGRDWWLTACACLAGSLPMVLFWAVNAEADIALTVTIGVLVVFAVLCIGTAGAGWYRKFEDALGPGPVILTSAAAALLFGGLLEALGGEVLGLDARALGLATTGVAFLLASAAVRPPGGAQLTASGRDFRTGLWMIGLAFIAVALPLEVRGLALTAWFGVVALAIAGAAHVTGEDRLCPAAIAFLGLQLGYVLLLEAPPELLFDNSASPGREILSVVVAASTATVLCLARVDGVQWRMGLVAAALVIYAGSLEIVTILSDPDYDFDALGSASTSFQRAHTVVSIFWGGIGFAALIYGLRRGLSWLRLAGLALLGLAVAKAFLFDLSYLTTFARAITFLGLGALLLAAAFFQQRLGGPPTDAEGA